MPFSQIDRSHEDGKWLIYRTLIYIELLMEPAAAIAVSVMDARGCLFVCLCICVIGCGVLGQGHGSICRPNERFLSCGGCQKTCQDPAPDCTAVCRTGCYCNENEVRNETGHCVKLSECPPVAPAKLQSSEPRQTNFECPADEEYRSCEPCNKTCDNPNPICPAQCARGCFCRDDLVRDKDGRCVKLEECSNIRKDENSNLLNSGPLVYQLTCGPHQYYSSRQNCEKSCSSSTLVCSNDTGCFCQDGFLRAPNGQCVRLEDCPKAEVSFGAAHEPTIEDCFTDEIYLSCGWCEPSCWDPKPQCPLGVCTRGCLCRPPLLRHHSGHCVTELDCTPQKCMDPNEEYVCRYGCEARCDAKICDPRPRRCILGCHCKLGLLRNSLGKCVHFNQCDTTNASHFNSSEESTKYVIREAAVTEDVDGPKSVFGPIPEEFDLMPTTEESSHEDILKPFSDIFAIGNGTDNKDDTVVVITKVNDLGNSQFFETKSVKEENVKTYVSELINAMKELAPQSINLTIVV
ncbi:trypsin inhibitor like cysteine rich domain-containing protein [Phthorimaea operculella]|nr:trypsin inhibitor like cysteine rich domain-containing protein [Phthorimaea operculella]